jgi:hypothetical protein
MSSAGPFSFWGLGTTTGIGREVDRFGKADGAVALKRLEPKWNSISECAITAGGMPLSPTAVKPVAAEGAPNL